MGTARSLAEMWNTLGVDTEVVVPLGETLTARTWSTLAGQSDTLSSASADVHQLPETPARLEHDTWVPDVVLKAEIGRGAMGVVYTGLQHSLGREVAVKRLRAPARPQARAALVNEARITGVLEHPNIPPVHLLCQDDGEPVLVMKRIEGQIWSDLIKDEGHEAWARTHWSSDEPLLRNIAVAEIVCDALAYAHSRGIVHRDVKPANIMIGAFGQVYLLDWGMATRWAELAHKPVQVVGTPAYMSPEMVDGRAEPRSDVYLVGAVLHQVITGRHLHTGKTLYQCLASIYETEPLVYDEQVPAELAVIARRACAIDPEDRYPTILALQQALRTFRKHRSGDALVRESERRLRLAAEAEEGDAGRLLTEARFGFLQVLRDWESPAARGGLHACSLALASWEIERGHLEAARRYLEDLGTVPEALRVKVEALEQSHAKHSALHARAKDLDPAVASSHRVRYMAVIALSMLGLAVAVSWSARQEGAVAYRVAIWGAGNAALFTLMIGVLFRERLFSSAYNRQSMYLVVLASCGIFVSRILMQQLGVSVTHALVADLVFLSGLAGAAGITMARWLLWLCGLSAGAAIGAALLPGWIPIIVGATAVAGAGITSWFLWGHRGPTENL